jgi:hypothetical protein
MRMHFNDEIWADYVRGLSAPGDASAIEQHFRSDCDSCLQSFRFWQAFADYAAGEARIQIPERDCQGGRAAYSEWFRRFSLPSRARMARLIIDSLLQPLPAGIRSGGPSPRRMLATLGSWSVDLRLESPSDQRIFMAGQILRSGKGGTLVNAPVVLMSGGALVAETSANDFGEFQLQFEKTSNLRLYVAVTASRPMGIDLPDLSRGPTAAELFGR